MVLCFNIAINPIISRAGPQKTQNNGGQFRAADVLVFSVR